MWDLAPEFNALLVFGEHRYFGKSLPFGNETYSDPKSGKLRFLSSEQALADYAKLLTHLKEQWNAHDAPIVSFGGSYGGMLAAWSRMKYPSIFNGAIAGSAPVWQFTNLTK
ncbi:PRCP [Symbiodinium sp. KB8]|nr:PRCP [Symbiodinium sp. KB8]